MDLFRRPEVDVRQPLPVAGDVVADDVRLGGEDLGGPVEGPVDAV